MAQQQNQPIHWDTPKSRLNITLILSLGIFVIGLFTQSPVLLVLGVAGAAFTWFTNAKQYLIYENALVIAYGRPRVKAFPFAEISHLEMLVLPMGNRLRVRMVNGRPVMVAAKNIDEFRDRLDEALEKFNGSYHRQQLQDEGQENSTPY
jgi:hypothetical protein